MMFLSPAVRPADDGRITVEDETLTSPTLAQS